MLARTDDEIDRLFTEFEQDRRSAAPRPLAAWMLEYPEYRGLLVQWATELPALEVAESRPAYELKEDRTRDIGEAVLRRLGFLESESGEAQTINQMARARGLSPRQLADRVGVGITLVAKLNRRLIRAASVPTRLVERLADELSVSADRMREYLALPPSLAQGAAYKADQAPEVSAPEDFAEAVRRCADMSPEQKQDWLG